MPTNSNAQLAIPLDAIIFDCDGTLSAIEGIDELARLNGAGAKVAAMTAAAMGSSGINPALYQERLSLVQPQELQVIELGNTYYQNRVPDCEATIHQLQQLNKKVFILSAGLKPSIDVFAKLLKIPSSDVYAVNIFFNERGGYVDFDKESPLTHADGKAVIVKQILQSYPRLGYVGDGLNDLVARDLVTRFIGYGGVFYRANIAEQCEFYSKNPSLAALLPLLMTEAEITSSGNQPS